VVRKFEGLHRRTPAGVVPYLCPAGVWTIGYGSTHYADGRAVRRDDPPMSEQDCEDLLMTTLPKYMAQAVAASPVLSRHPRRWAAIGSFIFNLGGGRYRSSTLRKCINAEDWQAACEQIMRWTRGGGRVLPGLVARRRVEAAMLT
jgi:lysozyme